MRRLVITFAAASTVLLLTAAPAMACGGLIGPNGAVNLLRTTTFAGYHDGVEHYVTAFQFAGGEGEFGSIVPLPGIPSNVEKGGDWTLQRLVQETDPPELEAAFDLLAAPAAGRAEVLQEVRIDALDVTILRGGGDEVGAWAREHGFRLPPDAPEVLDFYARRSPIFMAAVFDADAARQRGQQVGDGTPVHLTIPTDDPWVPLRILGLGKAATESVEADVYLLTDERPELMPSPLGRDELILDHSQRASEQLLTDLRSDQGMRWVPADAWLTKLVIAADAGELAYDLAISAGGGRPDPVAAGLEWPAGTSLAPEAASASFDVSPLTWAVAVAVPIVLVAGLALGLSRRWPLAGA
jgi:hypothetical protein